MSGLSPIESIGIKLLESKLKEIKPEQVLGVFGEAVKDEIAHLKANDSDKNGVDDFNDCLADLTTIEQAGERILKRLQAAKGA